MQHVVVVGDEHLAGSHRELEGQLVADLVQQVERRPLRTGERRHLREALGGVDVLPLVERAEPSAVEVENRHRLVRGFAVGLLPAQVEVERLLQGQRQLRCAAHDPVEGGDAADNAAPPAAGGRAHAQQHEDVGAVVVEAQVAAGLEVADVAVADVAAGVLHAVQEQPVAVLRLGGAEVGAQPPEQQLQLPVGVLPHREAAQQHDAAAAFESPPDVGADAGQGRQREVAACHGKGDPAAGRSTFGGRSRRGQFARVLRRQRDHPVVAARQLRSVPRRRSRQGCAQVLAVVEIPVGHHPILASDVSSTSTQSWMIGGRGGCQRPSPSAAAMPASCSRPRRGSNQVAR